MRSDHRRTAAVASSTLIAGLSFATQCVVARSSFTASYGSGGETGLPSNWIRIVGTVENPWYEPTYNYGLDPSGHTEVTDPWKRHIQFPEVCAMGFGGPTSGGLPTEPPPPPTPEPEPTHEEV